MDSSSLPPRCSPWCLVVVPWVYHVRRACSF